MKPGNIELHIEELVLNGFGPVDRYRIGVAVEVELARLFAEQSVPPPSLRFSRMSFSQMSATRFGLLPCQKCYGVISSTTENFLVSFAESLMTP